MRFVGPMQRNSWRVEFEGTIFQDGTGTKLAGTLGPIAFVPVFSAVWFGAVCLFFFGGLIGFFSDLLTRHGSFPAAFVLIPMAMLLFFVAITEFGARAARREWTGMEEWLRTLLDVPPHTPWS